MRKVGGKHDMEMGDGLYNDYRDIMTHEVDALLWRVLFWLL